jgi:N-acetylmuramoyl-L-alanine amidase
MINALRIRRRLILCRLAGGSTLLYTFLAKLDPRTARAALPVGTAPLIIIDPGHGGHDPGAIGVTGTLEKDVTLASALALRATLVKTGRYRVELTRTEDRYIGCEERVGIARELGASLFLSMHADRLSDPSVRGASVYTLAKRASDAETEALAERENGLVPGEHGRAEPVAPEVSEILLSLAARENRVASTRIAHQLVRDLGHNLPVLNAPERHANFIVLHAARIPSVLIEMGFLSNPADEAALNEPGHRDLIARSATRAIDAWFGTMPA